jgi:hypothetical protein
MGRLHTLREVAGARRACWFATCRGSGRGDPQRRPRVALEARPEVPGRDCAWRTARDASRPVDHLVRAAAPGERRRIAGVRSDRWAFKGLVSHLEGGDSGHAEGTEPLRMV